MAQQKQKSAFRSIAPFVLGGLSGMCSTTIIQPVDMIKVRIQLMDGAAGGAVQKGPLSLASTLIREEGFMALYKGLSAAWLRQATYTTARIGFFRTFSNAMQGESTGPLPFWKKAVAGLSAGAIGATFGTPADLALVRMQADGTMPAAQRRGYKNVADALIRIIREEGVRGMFAGNAPVVGRAAMLNFGMLSTYDQCKEMAKPYFKSTEAQTAVAKVSAGFFASFFSLPFDFVKTRMQKQRPGADGKLPYPSMVKCFQRVAAEEGIGTFYRGFTTYYFRIAPHAMFTLFFLERLNALTSEW
jgi:solute carrier family 25 (mitochondrial oxoglutarate transporter), member 11